jgi:putative mRNA 3-end processing factor
MRAGAFLGLEATDAGVVLQALGLALDPRLPTQTAFVSHVHAAAAASGSAQAIASPETIALRRALAPGDATAFVPLAWGEHLEMPIDRAFGGGTARLTIEPAGHVLGAAQLVVEHPRGRLVYTGDWSREDDGTRRAGVAIACDEIVVTSTFALPIFRFEPMATTLAALVGWCAERIACGVRPIVLAQNPGPAQSIVSMLTNRGFLVEGHDAVVAACAAYEALGSPLGRVASLAEQTPGAIRLLPANARAMETTARGKSSFAYASGWATLDAAVEQKRADAAFVVADHADGDATVELVRSSGARRVIVTRGDARPFASMLRSRGLDADALELSAIDDRGGS